MMENAMSGLNLDLENLEDLFPDDFDDGQVARAQTIFLKELSLLTHKFYGGKMMTVPKAGLYGFNWFNVWYTPGVSRVSTAIRGSQDWFVPGVSLPRRANVGCPLVFPAFRPSRRIDAA